MNQEELLKKFYQSLTSTREKNIFMQTLVSISARDTNIIEKSLKYILQQSFKKKGASTSEKYRLICSILKAIIKKSEGTS